MVSSLDETRQALAICSKKKMVSVPIRLTTRTKFSLDARILLRISDETPLHLVNRGQSRLPV